MEAEGIAPSSVNNPASVSTSVAPDFISQAAAPRSGLRCPPVRNWLPYRVPGVPPKVSLLSDGDSEIGEKSPRSPGSLFRLPVRNCCWQLFVCRLVGTAPMLAAQTRLPTSNLVAPMTSMIAVWGSHNSRTRWARAARAFGRWYILCRTRAATGGADVLCRSG